jgi:hypothetical protein
MKVARDAPGKITTLATPQCTTYLIRYLDMTDSVSYIPIVVRDECVSHALSHIVTTAHWRA